VSAAEARYAVVSAVLLLIGALLVRYAHTAGRRP
jgi:hypothetical protein